MNIRNVVTRVYEFFESAKQWVVQLFTSGETTPAQIAKYVVSKDVPFPPIRRSRTKQVTELATLPQLLDTLSDSFSLYQLPFNRYSWIPKDTAIGLRKMGAHIPHPAIDNWGTMDEFNGATPIKLEPGITLPSMFCCHTGLKRAFIGQKKEMLSPVFIFGTKEKTLPYYVDRMEGVHYRFGFAYCCGNSAKDIERLIWLSGFITIKHDGELYVHKECKTKMRAIPCRSSATRRAYGSYRLVPQRAWYSNALADSSIDDHPNMSVDEAFRLHACSFKTAITWFAKRNERWSITVHKGGERVTFGVPRELVVKFFAARDKTEKTETGATRRIIHYVAPFVRRDGAKVKGHIRGLRKFSWKTYQCQVNAPEFHDVILASEFDVAGEEVDNALVDGEEFIHTSKLGSILAACEDGHKTCP